MSGRGKARRITPSLVISMLALFVALSGWGYAATGGTFRLGKTNTAGKTTTLKAKKGPALSLRSNNKKPAASFNVKKGVAPFTVSNGTKIKNLNADKLDGIDSKGFYRSGSKVADSDKLDGLDSTALQRRVNGTCAAGTAIRVVNADGTVTCDPGTPSWALAGNANTNPNTDFLGTNDNQDLAFHTNGAEHMRLTAAGFLGIGTATPIGQLESSATGQIALLGTSDSRGVVGRLGQISCAGTYAVGGCAGGTGGAGVLGRSETGSGTSGSSTTGIGVSGATTTAGRAVQGFAGPGGIGVIGDSDTRGVIGTVSRAACPMGTSGGNPAPYGVGGCAGGGPGDGVVARANTGRAVRATVTDATGTLFVGLKEVGGTISQVARIDSTGKGFFNGGTQGSGADYAESVKATDSSKLSPGDVLSVDTAHGRTVRKSSGANSSLIAGVYSTKPSMLAVGAHGINDKRRGEVPVALVGIVPTKVTAQNGAIHRGDLLTTARTPGRAMRARAVKVGGVPIYRTGTILGKALDPLPRGQGVIRVLVTLR